jgi:orotate phosphoribosyltransferase-like protein
MISNLSKETMSFLRSRFSNSQDKWLLDKQDIALSQSYLSVFRSAFNDIELIMNDLQAVYADFISTTTTFDVNDEAIDVLLNKF